SGPRLAPERSALATPGHAPARCIGTARGRIAERGPDPSCEGPPPMFFRGVRGGTEREGSGPRAAGDWDDTEAGGIKPARAGPVERPGMRGPDDRTILVPALPFALAPPIAGGVTSRGRLRPGRRGRAAFLLAHGGLPREADPVLGVDVDDLD